MTRFRRLLFRERRRLILFVTMVTLSAFLVFSAQIGPDAGIRNAAVAAFGTGVGAGMIALAMLMVSPDWRHSLETVGISLFVYTALIVQVQGVAFATTAHAMIAFTGFLVLAALVHTALYGSWSDRIFRLRRGVERTTCLTRLDRDSVWAAVCPDPRTVSSYWDNLVQSVTELPDDPDRMVLFRRYPNGLMSEEEVRFDQMSRGKSLRYFYQRLGASEIWGERSLSLVLERREGHIALHMRWERCGFPMRLALRHWIDDRGGRMMDRHITRIEAMALSEGVPDPAPAPVL